MNTMTVRRALVALLTALAIGAGIAPQAADVLKVTPAPAVQLAGSKGGLSRVGRESAQAPVMQLAGSKGGLGRAGRESS